MNIDHIKQEQNYIATIETLFDQLETATQQLCELADIDEPVEDLRQYRRAFHSRYLHELNYKIEMILEAYNIGYNCGQKDLTKNEEAPEASKEHQFDTSLYKYEMPDRCRYCPTNILNNGSGICDGCDVLKTSTPLNI